MLNDFLTVTYFYLFLLFTYSSGEHQRPTIEAASSSNRCITIRNFSTTRRSLVDERSVGGVYEFISIFWELNTFGINKSSRSYFYLLTLVAIGKATISSSRSDGEQQSREMVTSCVAAIGRQVDKQ